MSALQVEQLKLGDEEPERLPQILLEVCAAISVKEEPIKTLVTSMQGELISLSLSFHCLK